MRDENMFIKDKISDSTIRSLYERKSVRVFTGEHIPEDDVRIIAEAAAQAPTAGNQQLYTILRITNPDKKHRLSISCDNQPLLRKLTSFWSSVLTAFDGIGFMRKPGLSHEDLAREMTRSVRKFLEDFRE